MTKISFKNVLLQITKWFQTFQSFLKLLSTRIVNIISSTKVRHVKKFWEKTMEASNILLLQIWYKETGNWLQSFCYYFPVLSCFLLTVSQFLFAYEIFLQDWRVRCSRYHLQYDKLGYAVQKHRKFKNDYLEFFANLIHNSFHLFILFAMFCHVNWMNVSQMFSNFVLR